MSNHLATFTSQPYYTPDFMLPEPGDPLHWKWAYSLALFSQRSLKYATYGTVFKDGAFNSGPRYVKFDYSSMGNDVFPPYLEAYRNKPEIDGTRWVPSNHIGIYGTYNRISACENTFIGVTLGYATFFCVSPGTYQFIAYL